MQENQTTYIHILHKYIVIEIMEVMEVVEVIKYCISTDVRLALLGSCLMSAYVPILQINSKLMASFSFFPFAIPAALRMQIVNSTTSSTALNDLETYKSKHMCNVFIFFVTFLYNLSLTAT